MVNLPSFLIHLQGELLQSKLYNDFSKGDDSKTFFPSCVGVIRDPDILIGRSAAKKWIFFTASLILKVFKCSKLLFQRLLVGVMTFKR